MGLWAALVAVNFSHRSVIGWINRNDVDFISIILDTIQNSLSQWTVISAKLVKPSIELILRAEDSR